MANEPKPDNNNREYATRTVAIEMSIRAGCGQCYDDEGRTIFDAGEIIKGAKIFEDYIKSKGSVTEMLKTTTTDIKKEW